MEEKTTKIKQLRDILMNEGNTISIEEAITNAKKRWLKQSSLDI